MERMERMEIMEIYEINNYLLEPSCYAKTT
jgi:hypothetical protein